MSLYKNRYRIESARLGNWDYSSNGYYFITICTKNRKHLLGEIKNGKMNLSDIGKIAYQYWQDIPIHFLFIRLENFIIMPNHMHGIITIGNQNVETPNFGISTIRTNKNAKNKYWNPGNLGVIVNQYKRKCTIEARKIDPYFGWLPRYHDHIIRNNGELIRIREYIQNNPFNWKEDNLYTGSQL
ncbi:MAG: hypothetical protein KAH95_05270 [Spirochaetales bacterium]|nr:hypothetical protein [Spirochaetales bacterium]